VQNPPQPQPKPHFIGFNFFIDRAATMKLVAAVNGAVQQRAQSVTLCISSNGGSTEQAFYAYEILRALPVPIHTINLGIVQSAANIIFMAGEQRVAVPEAHFLFHQTKFSPQTGGNYSLQDLAFSAASVKSDDDRTAQIVAERTGKPIAEVLAWFEGQELRTADFALQNGIIQAVRHLQMPQGAEFFQVTL
jgi:ATP-dependent protease ClpP protease subunit